MSETPSSEIPSAAHPPAAMPSPPPQVGAPPAEGSPAETFNPWSVVNLVFTHLAAQGLHPVLGEAGDPGKPAAALLVALGIQPAPEGNRQVMRDVHDHLGVIRAAMFGDGDPEKV